eukprot:649150-Hanusia_phi.AAC.3
MAFPLRSCFHSLLVFKCSCSSEMICIRPLKKSSSQVQQVRRPHQEQPDHLLYERSGGLAVPAAVPALARAGRTRPRRAHLSNDPVSEHQRGAEGGSGEILGRHVILPQETARMCPKNKLLTETEWRSLGVQQSRGWVHYAIHKCVGGLLGRHLTHMTGLSHISSSSAGLWGLIRYLMTESGHESLTAG